MQARIVPVGVGVRLDLLTITGGESSNEVFSSHKVCSFHQNDDSQESQGQGPSQLTTPALIEVQMICSCNE
jgi:hypothetical protein